MQMAYGANQYKKQEILGASPLRLVIMAYDLAIRACDKQDFQTAVKAITALRDALDYDYAEVAAGLLSLYQWCLDCIRKGDYDSAKKTLVELREAWANVEKQLNTVSEPSSQTGISPALQSA
ncbi:MAG TPA: flagellar protein FliS [Anaerolineaceae bacterium]|nr:flagellar protein FliS [Anaerolineaceae bacterium]HPN52567.1 flagellar protein FliS [Anaerolineaceae bacterium]